LKAAALFDGKNDTLVTPGLVIVSDGYISAVGPNSTIPATAEVLDLGDATLLPGFIDAHTHLSFPYSEDYDRSELESLQKTVAERALDASVNARVTLMAGFTTVRVPSSPTNSPTLLPFPAIPSRTFVSPSTSSSS
jgi:imidazolonepropionase-like amidohydrolase